MEERRVSGIRRSNEDFLDNSSTVGPGQTRCFQVLDSLNIVRILNNLFDVSREPSQRLEDSKLEYFNIRNLGENEDGGWRMKDNKRVAYSERVHARHLSA